MPHCKLRLPFLLTLWVGVVAIFPPQQCVSQNIKAQAISYAATLDLSIFDPVYYDQTDSDSTDVYFEVDAYFTSGCLRTITRVKEKPADYQANLQDLIYDTHGAGEYLIDNKHKSIIAITSTGTGITRLNERKTIMGHRCRGYLFVDHNGVRFIVFVTKKLSKNISPLVNMSLPGTALELITSNGFHLVATDFSEGELPPSFFLLPTDYQTKTISSLSGD